MTRIRVAVAIVICAATGATRFSVAQQPVPPDEARPVELSLERCIEYALEHSPQLAQAGYLTEAAAAGVGVAKGGERARFDLVASGSYARWPWMIMPMSPLTDLTSAVQFGNVMIGTGVQFEWPLVTGGRTDAEVQGAQAMERAALRDYDSTRDQLIYDVTQAYFHAALLQQMVDADQGALDAMADLARVIQQQLDVGKAAPVELSKVMARHAEARQRLISDKAELDVSYAELERLINWKVKRARIEPEKLPPPAPAPTEAERLAELALRTRPALHALREELAAAEADVRAVESDKDFQLSLMGYVGGLGAPRQRVLPDARIGLGARWLLGDGGKTNAEISRKRAEAKAAAERLKQTQLDVRAEVYRAHAALTDALARVEAATEGLKQAEEVLRVERLRYDVGRGITYDVLEAIRDYLEARTNLLRATLDAHTAAADLRRAVGAELPPEQPKP